MIKRNVLFGVLIFTMIGVFSTERHVGQGQEYTTIQAAVDTASAGDVIIIHAGTYREQVRIGVDNITIQPNESDTVIINGTEPLLSWTHVGNGVYKTIMDWDINETDQTNQIFVDGKMIYLTRWPDQTNDDYVLSPVMAEMNGVEQISWNLGEILDFEFIAEQDTLLWEGAQIFINLSSPKCKMDGHGYTETIQEIVDGKIRVRAFGGGRYKSCDNWSITSKSKYYLFNPTPAGVAATGGVTALLSNGEWWKHGDSLFIKMPDGGVPASSLGETNLVEAKKYPFAFRPDSAGTFSNVTIKNLTLFATSITTDDVYNTRTDIAAASNNVFDNLDVKYVTHSDDASGDFQQQWAHNSGIIVSGTNNVLKNTEIVYSNVAGVTILGNSNSVLNCIIHDVNYNLNELGAISTGYRRAPSVNHNIGYNTIYNTTHCGISIRGLNEHPEEVKEGQARIHHNKLYNCITRVHDAGIIDGSKNKYGLRIDHNIMYDSPDFLNIGIYLDYGKQVEGATDYPVECIIDHNVIYNVWNPLGLNACSYLQVYNNTLLHNKWKDIGGVHLQDKEVYIQNNFASAIDDFGDFAVINHNFGTSIAKSNNYFTDADNGDFTLTSNATEVIDSSANVFPYNGLVKDAPDIGAYEYGKPAWEAGATDSVVEFYKLTLNSTNGKVHPANHLYRKGEIVPIAAENTLGYVFDNWSGDITSDSNVVEIKIDSNITATANYIPTHTYTLSIEATNGKEYRQPAGGEFNPGTKVKLTAIRFSEDYEFSGWTGSITDTANPITITMDENKTITANFPLRPVYKLSTNVTNGRITLNPTGGEYYEGTEVNILAIADSGYKFDHWSGDTNLFDYSVSRQNIIVNQNMSITANFVSTHGIGGQLGLDMNVNIYPNPNKGNVLNITTSDLKHEIKVCVFNLTGTKIYENVYNLTSFKINLSEMNIKNGFYVIEIIVDDKKVRKQLIIN